MIFFCMNLFDNEISCGDDIFYKVVLNIKMLGFLMMFTSLCQVKYTLAIAKYDKNILL